MIGYGTGKNILKLAPIWILEWGKIQIKKLKRKTNISHLLLKLALFWIYLALGFPYSIGRKAGISNYVSFFRTLSYIILPFLQQSDSDNEDQEEEVYDHEEEEHRHNYAENPSGLTRNSLIGKQLFRIYEKDPRPSVERKN